MLPPRLVLTFLTVALWKVSCVPLITPSSPTHLNTTSSVDEDSLSRNVTDAAVGSRISSIMTHLPTLKNIVILVCVVTAALITCLVVKVVRSGRRIRKTRKYDIITTPAERVEMAPLNEENEEEDDSTVFDVKYRWTLVWTPLFKEKSRFFILGNSVCCVFIWTFYPHHAACAWMLSMFHCFDSIKTGK